MHKLEGISPVDGRYADIVTVLRPYFSEQALISYCVGVECEWLKFIIEKVDKERIVSTKHVVHKAVQEIYDSLDHKDILRIKEIEKKIDHYVKAIEYFLQEKLKEKLDPSLHSSVIPLIHIGCTSEDITNLAYGMLLKNVRTKVIGPMWELLIIKLSKMAQHNANVSMLSRTHGQPATPTTMGKELANFVFRLKRQYFLFKRAVVMGKFGGAVGNSNALMIAFPNINWIEMGKVFVQEKVGLIYNPYTTQIEPHDMLAEFFAPMMRFNIILIDMCRDIWGYISLGYIIQRPKEGTSGSSTMPHKVNPKEFENAEGNLEIADALFNLFCKKLPVSRFQRDLTDSTVMRNIGVAFAHSYIAYNSIHEGLQLIDVCEPTIYKDLLDKWEVLGEAVQTVMRKHGIIDAYEQLKELTRGHEIEAIDMINFISNLEIPQEDKDRLLELTPLDYIGYAADLATHNNIK